METKNKKNKEENLIESDKLNDNVDKLNDNNIIEKSNFLKKIYKLFNINKLHNMNFNIIEVVIVFLMAATLGFFVCEIVNNGNNYSASSYNSEINEVYNTLINNYDGTVDSKGLSDSAIEGMINYLGDEYSIYFDETETNDFYEELDGSFIGLGVEMQLDDNNIATIINVLADSAASRSGIEVGDKIIKVDDEDVTKNSLSDLSSKIKGAVKNIKLTLMRDNKEIEINVTTGKVNISSITSDIYEKNNKKIGYIYISVFASNTDEQFKNALDDLNNKEIDSLIIDVRGNLGGHLDSVTNILNLFLDKSQILYQLKNGDKISKVNGKNDEVFNKEIVVLADSSSASASEVLTSALIESNNSTFIGKKTYGKGTVQTTLSLSSGAMIKYTSEEWLTPNGNSINKKGIDPSIDVSLNSDYFIDYNKDKDNQLQTALNFLSNK